MKYRVIKHVATYVDPTDIEISRLQLPCIKVVKTLQNCSKVPLSLRNHVISLNTRCTHPCEDCMDS